MFWKEKREGEEILGAFCGIGKVGRGGCLDYPITLAHGGLSSLGFHLGKAKPSVTSRNILPGFKEKL